MHTRTPWWLPPAAPDTSALEHGTFTTGVLAGRHGSNLPGLAPHCRVVALALPVTEHTVPDPLSAAHAVEELVEAGADIIQYSLAHHTAPATPTTCSNAPSRTPSTRVS